jgi:hypothetical protein
MKGLLLKKFYPVESCGEHTIWIFLLVYLEKNDKIKTIETSVHQVFTDGSYDELNVPLFQHDYRKAREILIKIINSSHDKSHDVIKHISLLTFCEIIGLRDASSKVEDLVKAVNMRKSISVFSLTPGYHYETSNKQIQIKTDEF